MCEHIIITTTIIISNNFKNYITYSVTCPIGPLKSVLDKSIYFTGLSTFHSLAVNNSKLSLGYYFISPSQHVASFIFIVARSVIYYIHRTIFLPILISVNTF
jgi:hypothetical protein